MRRYCRTLKFGAAGGGATVHPSQHVHPLAIQQYPVEQRTALLGVARHTLSSALVRRLPAEAAVDQAVRSLLPSADAANHAWLGAGMDSPWAALWEDRACFVTLWRRDNAELRGCRGECRARQPLALAVGYMALAAGLDDPRFSAATADELPLLRVEISVLTPLRPIAPQEVEVGRHGLMIVAGRQRGLLLPQVAVEHHLDREQFLEAVCWKAGLEPDAWRATNAALWAFETESWAEV
jgi:AmmeMemoRadiSam system protein A